MPQFPRATRSPPCSTPIALGPTHLFKSSCNLNLFPPREGGQPAGRRTKGMGFGGPHVMSSQLRRVQGPHCFKALLTGETGISSIVWGPCISWGYRCPLPPSGGRPLPQGREPKPVTNPHPSPASRGSPGKCQATEGHTGPGSRVSGLENPGNCCSGGTGSTRGPGKRCQVEGRGAGSRGVKEARLGSSPGGLPKRQQGPSWQGQGAEPSPRGRERKGQRVPPRCPFLLPILFLFPLTWNFLSRSHASLSALLQVSL